MRASDDFVSVEILRFWEDRAAIAVGRKTIFIGIFLIVRQIR
jgi:hypothetical protein